MLRQLPKALYAGSFDPITNGHLWMITEGARLFDHLVVVVADNATKRTMFTVDERVALVKASLPKGIACENVVVMASTNAFTVDTARAMKAQYLLRGLRSAGDFDYERTLRHVNEDIGIQLALPAQPDPIHTVFLMPPRELAEISSSFIKGLIGLGCWEKVAANYVPSVVLRGLQAKADANFPDAEFWKRMTIGGAKLPPNLNKPVLEVWHADLERLTPRSPYRSKCPVCPDGGLLIRRQPEPPYALLCYDNCVLCGQPVKYLDEAINTEKLVDPTKKPAE